MDNISDAILLALAIMSHAWVGRITAPPALLSAIGWAANGVTLLVLALRVF